MASIYGGNASGNAAGGAQAAASAGLQVHSIVPIIIGEERRLEPSESADGSMVCSLFTQGWPLGQAISTRIVGCAVL